MNRKTTIPLLLFFVGVAIGIHSCTKYEYLNPKFDLIAEAQILEAKQYFESQFKEELTSKKDESNLRKGNPKRIDLKKDLVWEQASIKELSNGQSAVYVPVSYDEDWYLKSTRDPMALTDLTYVLFFNDEKGAKSLEVVTTFPDSVYLNAFVKPDIFTGLVYVEDWKGNLKKSFLHKDGKRWMLDAVDVRSSNARMALCEYTTDYFICYSIDGGETWNCRYEYSETHIAPCENGGGSGGDPIPVYGTEFDYDPATGGGSSGGDNSGGDSTTIEVCEEGYFLNYKGECERIVEPCETGDEVIDATAIQTAFASIWENSNASSKSDPMADRREDGGWIVKNGDDYSYVTFPATWTRTACGIDPPENWDGSDAPENVVGFVHSHPFYIGEDVKDACNTKTEAIYGGGPSIDDQLALISMGNTLGLGGAALIGYVIDGDKITSYDWMGKLNAIDYNRCGY